MKLITKLLTTLSIVLLTSSLYASPLFKVKTDFIITKDSIHNLRVERTTYKFFSLASSGNQGIYSETFAYNRENRLVYKLVRHHKSSFANLDMPHIITEKTTYYNRKGDKTRVTFNKRISDGFTTLVDKEVRFNEDGSKQRQNHRKGTKKKKSPKYVRHTIFRD